MKRDDHPEPTTDPGVSREPTLVRPSAPEALAGPDAEVTAEHPGRYALRGRIGEGTQGQVLLAWDSHLQREVAMKVPAAASGPGALVRFLREARILARLEHPHIVPVYEIGRAANGTVYCTQKLIRAGPGESKPRTLRKALQEAPGLEARLRLLPHLVDVCQGLAYAHQQGVIHRDLKPDNVVLGPFGETVILDWGLARLDADLAPPETTAGGPAPFSTVGGQAYGTPSYMSPEQARGETRTVDGRSDVWSLGAMLFELLTGRPPFLGTTPEHTVSLVRDAPVPDARTTVPEAPAELAAVAGRALQRDVGARYPTASALAEDLIAWQTGQRVGVYSYRALELVKLFVTRHKVPTAVALVGLLAVMVAALVARQQASQARRALAQALLEKGRLAERALQWDQAALLFAAARVKDDTPATRWAMRLAGARPAERVERLGGQVGPLKGLAFSPDGKLLLVGAGDGQLHLWQFASRTRLATLTAHASSVTAVAFAPNGRRFASGADDGTVKLFDAASRREVGSIPHSHDAANALAFSPDSRALAVGYEDGVLGVFDVETRAETWRSERAVLDHPFYTVAWAPDGRWLAWAGWEGKVWLRELPSGTTRAWVIGLNRSVLDLDFAPDGKHLALTGIDQVVQVRRVEDSAVVYSFDGHTQKVYSVAFSPDGRRLVSGGTDRTVRLWDFEHGQAMVASSFNDGEDLNRVRFTPDGSALVWAGSSGEVKVRRLVFPETVEGESNVRVQVLRLSRDGKWLLASGEASVKLIDAKSHQVAAVFRGEGTVDDAVLSATAEQVAWACRPRVVCLAGRAEPEVRREFALPGRVLSLAIAPDGSWLAAGGNTVAVRLWNAKTGALLGDLGEPQQSSFSLAVSPDGKWLASGGYDKTIRLMNVDTRAEVRVLRGHTHGVRRVEFSPDGQTLASASWDKTVRLWDVASGALKGVGDLHEDHVHGLAWDPKGRWLATGSWDGTLRLWDPVDAHPLGRAVADVNRVYSLAVDPGGDRLWYGGHDVHALDLRAIGEPEPDLRDLEERLGLTLDGVTVKRR